MKITHYCNSFISAEFSKNIIYCDPWVGTTKDNGWVSYPIDEKSIKNLNKPDYIYISHLHCDHFDEKTLRRIKKKKQKVIIKDYRIKTLKKKLEKAGLKEILELKPWKKYTINKEFEVAIIPQISSNSSEKEEQIDYDIDTSIVLRCKKTNKVFYNNVDNPLSVTDLKKVNRFIKKVFNSPVNILCFGVGAASEYPQCFLNIKRSEEKKKVINNSINKLKTILKIFKPKIFFPAGGTYKIYGKFHRLNKYIAQASFKQVKETNFKNILFKNLIGGKSIDLNKNKIKNNILKTVNTNTLNSKKYFYDKDKYNLKELDSLFNAAKINYFYRIKKTKFKTDWKIKFYIYKDLTLDNNSQIEEKKSKLIKNFEVICQNNTKKFKNSSFTQLNCYLDAGLFHGLLKRRYVWNSPVSGSLILYKRFPNTFDPNVSFSLNYLTL